MEEQVDKESGLFIGELTEGGREGGERERGREGEREGEEGGERKREGGR